MKLVVRPGEAAAAFAFRLVRGGMRVALRALTATDEGIHACRKEVRATRASLRLVEPLVRDRAYARVLAPLREAAHQLSQIRDQDALLERLAQWRTRQATAVRLIEPVVRAQRRLQQHHLAATIAAARAALEEAAARWQSVRVHGGWSRLVDGHLATWRAARSAWATIGQAAPDAHPHADWHRLRRRAKDLRHHYEVLEPLLPEVVGGWAKAWHALSDDLGEYQDLSLLLALIGVEAGAAPLRAPLQRRQQELVRCARRRAAPLLAERAGQVEQRLTAWLQAFAAA